VTGGKAMDDMNEKEIMNLSIDDFRELTAEETQEDNFRRMFQMLGLIFKNQQEIKELLVTQAVST
jgi:hypothetical protein